MGFRASVRVVRRYGTGWRAVASRQIRASDLDRPIFFSTIRSGATSRGTRGGMVRMGTHSHLDAAGGLAADGHVEEADGVGHCYR